MDCAGPEQFSRFPLLLVLLFVVSTCIKVLLIPAYRSTDFEVHRNWLAITSSLPLSQWYYENTSPWTLDYPPLFAWFQWFLSLPAAALDPLIVSIKSLDYATPTCVSYLRFTVICSDITLLYALFQYYHYQTSRSTHQHCTLATRKSLVVSLLILLNFGLFVVDHIHFQYNGFLFGILLLSIIRIQQERFLEGGFLFAVLLNLKHIFLYLSPAYFIFLLRHYCFYWPSNTNALSSKNFLIHNFIELGGVVIGVFLVSFGPFMYLGQLDQVLSRLFPFKRGLCHAYWAPNVWALYSLVDMVTATISSRLGIFNRSSCDADGCGSMTSGLVGEMSFKVLPNISPLFTMVLTGFAMLPVMMKTWFRRTSCPQWFLKILIICAYSSFLFGWHVHEKAVLLITIPMSLLAVEDSNFTKIYIFLSIAANISLFPLLHQSAEMLLKLCLFVMCTSMIFLSFGSVLSLPPPLPLRASSDLSQVVNTPAPADPDSPVLGSQKNIPSTGTPHYTLHQLSWLQSFYVICLLVVQIYCIVLHEIGPFSRYHFLPLLLTSVSCAVAVLLSWIQFLILLF